MELTSTAGDDERDRALISAHVAGDPDAFGELVRHHQRRLWAVAYRTLGDPDEAADAVQDACLSAYRAAGSFRGDARVTTWLHRIVVNACLDRARRRASRPTSPLPEHLPADPHDRLGESETAHVVQRALLELPDEQRYALVLVDLQGLSVAEAAEALQVPVGTVKSRCSRGRTRLAASLSSLRPAVPPSLAVPPGGGSVGNRAGDQPVPPATTALGEGGPA